MDAPCLAAIGLDLLLQLLSLVMALILQLASSLLASLVVLCSSSPAALAGLTSLARGASRSLLAPFLALLRFTLGDGESRGPRPANPRGSGAGASSPGEPSRPGAPDQGVVSVRADGHASLRLRVRRVCRVRCICRMRCICHVRAFTLSPALCVLGRVLNSCRGGTPNLPSLVLVRWSAALEPMAVAALLTYASSSSVTTAVLLYTLSQVALELLFAVGRLLMSMSLGLSGFVLLASAMAVTVTVMHPDFIMRRASQTLHPFQARLSPLGLQVWRYSLRLVRVSSQGGTPGTPQRARFRVFAVRIQRRQNPSEAVRSTSTVAAQAQGPETRDQVPTAGRDAATLQKEPEDQKCVICREQNKCVLLLPCRHLCLCQACSEMLMQLPTQRRHCPLCRRGIQRTLKVYV